MKKSIQLVGAMVMVAGLGLAQVAIAANDTQPYLYVYSVPGSGGGAGPMTATLTNYTNGSGSTVGLPGALPYKDGKPVIVQNGKMSGSVSADLVYHVTLGSVGASDCTLHVKSPDIGNKKIPNAKVTVVNDSAGMGLCTNFMQPVYTNNAEDGDQVITLNWKSK